MTQPTSFADMLTKAARMPGLFIQTMDAADVQSFTRAQSVCTQLYLEDGYDDTVLRALLEACTEGELVNLMALATDLEHFAGEALAKLRGHEAAA